MVKTLKKRQEHKEKHVRLETVMVELKLADHSLSLFKSVPKGHEIFEHYTSKDAITQRIADLKAELRALLKHFSFDECIAISEKASELACQVAGEASKGVFDESSPDYGNHQVTNFVNLFKLTEANAESIDLGGVHRAIKLTHNHQDSE